MEKSRVIVLAKKKNAKEVTRGYLVYNIGNPTPFIVCSYYQEYENKVEWDWGHYFDNLEDALKFFYQEEITVMMNSFSTILDGNITRFANKIEKTKSIQLSNELWDFEMNTIDEYNEHLRKCYKIELKK